MNVIVSNFRSEELSLLKIDIIKSINGIFSADDLIEQFSNFYYNRMILDVTALQNYRDVSNIQRLSANLDMSKLILLLDNSPECSSQNYISSIISLGIYNFTKNADNITYLINNPNSYKDVAHLHNIAPEEPVEEKKGLLSSLFGKQNQKPAPKVNQKVEFEPSNSIPDTPNIPKSSNKNVSEMNPQLKQMMDTEETPLEDNKPKEEYAPSFPLDNNIVTPGMNGFNQTFSTDDEDNYSSPMPSTPPDIKVNPVAPLQNPNPVEQSINPFSTPTPLMQNSESTEFHTLEERPIDNFSSPNVSLGPTESVADIPSFNDDKMAGRGGGFTPSTSDIKSYVIGIKNVTPHAGASTLTYMLKKQLQTNYNVLGIEVDKADLMLFNDEKLIQASTNTLLNTVYRESGAHEVILIDLNDYKGEDVCNTIIYLIEPTTIKLNKLMKRDFRIFDKLKGKKIVLNKSLLDSKDISQFEFESRSAIFYNIPPLDDKLSNNVVLDELLVKLGLNKQSSNIVSEGGLFSRFK